jgi:hypothetical protein
VTIYRDPRKPNPKPKGRYHGNSPTYRRNQIGDYGSNNDRFEKAIELVPGIIDQNNPWLFASGEADDGYWKVYILRATCREGCGSACPGETGKILVYPGEKPLRVLIALGPGLQTDAQYPYLEVHKWDRIPTTFSDLYSYRRWYSDLPFNSVVSLQPGIYSVSARNQSVNSWDTVCLGFGQIALGTLTLEMVSY